MRTHLSLGGLVISMSLAIPLTVVACGGAVRQPDATLPPSVQSGDYKVGWPDLGRGDARFIRIDLGPDVFAECQKLSPKFPFDSATTYVQDAVQLGELAKCLNAPGQRERRVVLVGRADARGKDDYNEALGMRRAEAIRRHLVESGLAESRIEIRTEGERGAVGYSKEYDHGYDRRVDVLVEGAAHTP